MRLLLCLTLITICALGSTRGADRTLQSWDFSKANGTLGWTQGSGIDNFGVRDGALSGTLNSDILRLVSPLFEIKATPLQYVEVELKCDAGGSANLYYSNTTEEPYAGFRPNLYASFDVKGDSKFHKYVIRPFWHDQGKIIHIRIDPPGRNFAIRKVQIIEPELGPELSVSSWEFKGSAHGWESQNPDDKVDATAAGLRISGNRNALALSGPLDFDSIRPACRAQRWRSRF